jgi:hypothetical protein
MYIFLWLRRGPLTFRFFFLPGTFFINEKNSKEAPKYTQKEEGALHLAAVCSFFSDGGKAKEAN